MHVHRGEEQWRVGYRLDELALVVVSEAAGP
jgi:hypothetical protein